MLTIFPRHTAKCRKAFLDRPRPAGKPEGWDGDMGRDYRKCGCPLHTEGTLGAVMVRRALDTANWTRAQGLVREWEAAGKVVDAEPEPQALTVAEAVRTFLASLTTKSAGRSKGTIRGMRSCLDRAEEKYLLRAKKRAINTGLVEYCELHGYTALAQLTLPVLTLWADSWTCGPLHRAKRIQLLRRFFRFAIGAEWTTKNPALAMEYPKGRALKLKPHTPFDCAHLPNEGPEMTAILAGAATVSHKLYAIVCLMRYAGLRISDATTFNASRVMNDGSIFLRMSKTSEAVSIPMHPRLKAALAVLTPNAAGNYFHSGACQTNTATDNWRVRFGKLFKRLKLTGAHPHRFRHTFAVDLLLRGVPIDQVSVVMGHHSVKITEKHYLAFVAARRAQLRDSLLAAWNMPTGPVAVPATKLQEAA